MLEHLCVFAASASASQRKVWKSWACRACLWLLFGRLDCYLFSINFVKEEEREIRGMTRCSRSMSRK